MPRETLYDEAQEAAKVLQSKIGDVPSLAIFAGTGSAKILAHSQKITTVSYHEIPHLATATVKSHKNEIVLAKIGETKVLFWTGRLHYYEGHKMDDITLPIRITGLLGVPKVILLNAAGGINSKYKPGDLVFAEDHINLFPQNPLNGYYDERWGPRFPDMMKVYDFDMNANAMDICERLGIRHHRGVYLGLQGPSLETPAEYRYLKSIGADLVGMSTIPEVVVAQQMGLKKMVISIVSNVVDSAGRSEERTTVDSVIETVNESIKNLSLLLNHLLI